MVFGFTFGSTRKRRKKTSRKKKPTFKKKSTQKRANAGRVEIAGEEALNSFFPPLRSGLFGGKRTIIGNSSLFARGGATITRQGKDFVLRNRSGKEEVRSKNLAVVRGYARRKFSSTRDKT